MPAPDSGNAARLAPTGRRPPRRIHRLVHLDALLLRVLETHLDRVDRKAPLPRHGLDAVNAALGRAAPLCARMPRGLRTAPFPRDAAIRPSDAFVALLKIHHFISQHAATLTGPSGDTTDDPPF